MRKVNAGHCGRNAYGTAAALVLYVVLADSSWAQRYEMVVLDLPPDHWGALPQGINNSGDIVGVAFEFANGHETPVLWRDDRLIQLAVLPDGSNSFSALQRARRRAWAFDINDDGLIVGHSSSRTFLQQPVMWLDERTVVPILDEDGWAKDINSAGVVVGSYLVGAFDFNAFLWENGEWFSLFPPMKDANDVNNKKQVVGDTFLAYLWEDGEFTVLPSLRPGSQSIPVSINDLGVISGWSKKDGDDVFPVIWRDLQIREMPGLVLEREGAVVSINNRGEAVGSAEIANEDFQPTFWRGNLATETRDLLIGPNPQGWRLESNSRINENGQIAATVKYPNQQGWNVARLDPIDTGLTLWGIEPSRPGQRNTIEVRHVTPNGRVSLLWGTQGGEPAPIPQCEGAMTDIVDPRLAATATAGPDGIARFRVSIPEQTTGLFILQAVDHTTCEVSPPARALIQPEG